MTTEAELEQLKKALPRMTDEQVKQALIAHNNDPYVSFEVKRGDAIREEWNKRNSRKANDAINHLIQRAGQG